MELKGKLGREVGQADVCVFCCSDDSIVYLTDDEHDAMVQDLQTAGRSWRDFDEAYGFVYSCAAEVNGKWGYLCFRR